jgi:hypothetical protein
MLKGDKSEINEFDVIKLKLNSLRALCVISVMGLAARKAAHLICLANPEVDTPP